ncbi:L,D-transpeptidase [Longimicrobium sp.]|uniref:L,D-transpeptidase n=1 Tax=Longimicrobium sp. TaxID=2029185 RepID=UPI002C8F6A34|nr:L,D-transpeptidase [Longimicrobium sp.]HSU15103.1 L,D-transpeptidase [Longimicrobium sp.]
MRISTALPIAAALAAALHAGGAADAQQRGGRGATPVSTRQPVRVRSEALARGGYAVVVDLDENELYFAKGRRVLWRAPVGTGTGLRMETDRDAWDFHTPNGAYHVTHKAREPDWIAPDWYFLEHNLAVPGPNDPKRRFTRGLGAAAVYIGHGLAIHGTDKPELLGRRVSHGCIRLSDANALRLYHDVQVGTEVVIVGGGREAVSAPPPAARASSRPAGTPPPRDPFVVELEGMETGELLARLDDELVADAFAESEAKWPSVASVLIFRGVKDDDNAALAGLLTRIDDLGQGRLRDEYAAILADAFTQGPLRTLAVLGRLDRQTREQVAQAIVSAAVGLYPGNPDDAATPWPTKRAPREVLDDRYAERAWDALHDAEQELREQRGLAVN